MAETPIEKVHLREVLIDVLGSLVPGIIFVMASLFVFAAPLTGLLKLATQLLSTPASVVAIYDSTAKAATALRFELTLFLLMLSYVAGHVFYRQDPKDPDTRSFRRTLLAGRPADLERWAATTIEECVFPYKRFDNYLRHRGLTHLVPLVTWAEPNPRTKNAINILKIRLWHYYPEKCGSIARNEAHIRLMSSTWYMAGGLFTICLLSISLSVATVLLAASLTHTTTFAAVLRYGTGAAPAIAVLMLSTWARLIIERFLHYQRVREVMWVLEQAHLAFRSSPEDIADICPSYYEQERMRNGRV